MADLPTFRDPSLLERALTHRSYLNEHPELALEDNERLEFLGDAVLDFITGAWLYNRFPELREGRLTSLRAALVKTETLAEFARRIGVNAHLRLGKGEAETGGRGRMSMLADAFEAVLGALYLDQGLSAVQEYLEQLLPEETDRILAEERDRDAKSVLQEWSQAERGITPRYRTVFESGPDHAKVFTVEVRLGDEIVGHGEGLSKQSAAQAAATDALKRLGII
ncbi:MAG TPA: ribonuclease III [Anaerolineae bacterium]|nr:ribonuclease III [Anaerolineae bacterium]